MNNPDQLYQWSTEARNHRERVSGKLPLQPMERPRDPWMKPALIGAGLLVAYFIWQFVR